MGASPDPVIDPPETPDDTASLEALRRRGEALITQSANIGDENPQVALGNVPPAAQAPPLPAPSRPGFALVSAAQAAEPPVQVAATSAPAAPGPPIPLVQPPAEPAPTPAQALNPAGPIAPAPGSPPTSALPTAEPEPPAKEAPKVAPGPAKIDDGNPGPPPPQTTALPLPGVNVTAPAPQHDAVPSIPRVTPSVYRYDYLQRTNPELWKEINSVAEEVGVDAKGLANLMFLESRWNPHVADSAAGAMGLMQVTRGAIKDVDRDGKLDPRNPHDNLKLGALYLRQMENRFGKNTTAAYVAYNMGPENVDQIGQLSPEEQKKHFGHALNYGYAVTTDGMTGDLMGGAPSPKTAPKPEDVNYLQPFSVTGRETSISTLRGDLAGPVAQMIKDMPENLRLQLQINSGGRTRQQQSDLYEADKASNNGMPTGMVAAPGSSFHDVGVGAAIDFGSKKTQDLLRDPNNPLTQWIHAYAADPKHGLWFPMDDPAKTPYEPWHIEPVATRDMRAKPTPGSPNGPQPAYAQNPGEGGTLTPAGKINPGLVAQNARDPNKAFEIMSQSPGTRGMQSRDLYANAIQNAYAYTLMNGGDATSLNGILQMYDNLARYGAMQHLHDASTAYVMKDFTGMAYHLNAAYNHFTPDGQSAQFRATPLGVVYDRYDNKGNRIGGEPQVIDDKVIARAMNITMDPQVWSKTMQATQQIENTQEHYKALQQHYQDDAQYKADRIKMEEAVAKLQATTAEKARLSAAQIAYNNMAQRRDVSEGEKQQHFDSIIRDQIGMVSDLKDDPVRTAAATSLVNNMMKRDSDTGLAAAIQISRNLINGDYVLGERVPSQTGWKNGAATFGYTDADKVPVYAKGDPSKTRITYLPINVLQQQRMWTLDPNKLNGPGVAAQPFKPPAPSPMFTPEGKKMLEKVLESGTPPT